MLKPVAFANSLTIVSAATYVVCRILTLAWPDLLFNIGQSWFHTLNLSTAKTTLPFEIGSFLFGAITLAVFVWITSYSFAKIYNYFLK